MIVERPKSLPLVAAHDRGIARDIAEHDRGKLAGRTRARRPARIGHLRFPALFHAKVSRRQKSRASWPFRCAVQKRCAVFRGYPAALPMRAAKSSRIFIYLSTAKLKRPTLRAEKGFSSDDKSISPAMSGCYPTRSCDGYDGQRISGITVSAKSRKTLR